MLAKSHKVGEEILRKVPPLILDIVNYVRFENVEACADEIALRRAEWRLLDKLHDLILFIDNRYPVRGRILDRRQADRHLTSRSEERRVGKECSSRCARY